MSDFLSIQRHCLSKNEQFTDDSFPAQNSSIYYNKIDRDIVWKRPKEICEHPKFIADGSSRFDLFQGALGNCWFVAAAAVLTTKTAPLRPRGSSRPKFRQCRVHRHVWNAFPADFVHRTVTTCTEQWRHVTENESDYYRTGIFRFNFWRYGERTEVVIDDRLPTKNGRLIFTRNRNTPDELWGPLLEKAYAKLHGSYQALSLGYANEALVDFTAGISETTSLREFDHPHKFFRTMKRAFKRGSLLTSFVQCLDTETSEGTRSNGIVVGHVYSITDIKQLKLDTNVKLLRLRNPWGKTEWNGAWSDRSDEWKSISESKKKDIGLTVKDDGEFWMPFTDWLDNFDTLEMCHLCRDVVRGGKGRHKWNVVNAHGEWVRGVTAGGCGAPPNEAEFWTNPRCYIRLGAPTDDDEEDTQDKCTLIVSLMQKHARKERTLRRVDETGVAIGFNLYEVIGNPNMDDLQRERADGHKVRDLHVTREYICQREVTLRFELHPGTYCIVPAAFTPGAEAAFLLRLAADGPLESRSDRQEDNDETEQPESPPKKKIRRFDTLFKRHSGDEEMVDARELTHILNAGIVRGNDEAFSKETCRALIQSIVGHGRAILDYADCKRVWKRVKELQNAFIEYDYNDSGDMDMKELRLAAKSVGCSLSTRMLERFVKTYCGKRNHLSLDDFVYCVTKVKNTHENYWKMVNRAPASEASRISLDEVLEMTL